MVCTCTLILIFVLLAAHLNLGLTLSALGHVVEAEKVIHTGTITCYYIVHTPGVEALCCY